MINSNKLLRITIYFLFAFLVIPQNVRAQKKLTKVSFNNISMKIPREFSKMNDDDMWQRSSSYRKAIALYTDENRVVELSINNAFARWEDGDIRLLQNVYKASIQQIFDDVKFSIEEIRNVNGRDFAVFEFVSKIRGDPGLANSGSITKYYYIQYTIVEGGTMVFNFSSQIYAKDEWMDTAGLIMSSVKIK